MIRAHKFLATGAVGPFSGYAWPVPEGLRPAGWVEWAGPLVPCVSGVHALRVGALPSWLDDELWSVELDSRQVVEEDGLFVARRGRLVERVRPWDVDVARAFARTCAERAGRLAEGSGARRLAEYAADAARYAAAVGRPKDAAVVAYVAAHAAEEARPGGSAAERAHQASWLAERLALAA